MKLALDYLDGLTRALKMDDTAHAYQVITALREALAEQPAQQEQVADKHQAFIDSLPSDMEDKMFEQIHYWARQSYARHLRSTGGQMSTAADSSDNHFIWAALRWAKENAPTPQAQPAQRHWVGLTEQEAAECWSTSTVRTWKAIESKLKEKNT